MSKQNNRLKVGVDIDGVLIDSNEYAYLNFLEKKLGWNIDYAVFQQTHSWYQATGQNSSAVLGDAFGQFLIEVENAQKPIDGAHDALKKLSSVADIFLVTARVGALRGITEDFLQTHLRDIRYHEISMDNVENKAPRVISFDLDYYIDDSHREISLILADSSISTNIIPFPSFHGRQRWRGMSDKRIYWLSVWNEIQDGIDISRHPEIRRAAWKEIVQIILEPETATVVSEVARKPAG